MSSTPGAPPGTWPSEGWLSKYDWKGYVPFDRMPSSYNPPEGFIVTANQEVDDRTEPFLTTDWDYGYRAQRIRTRLQAGGKISPAEMSSIQLDDREPFARDARAVPAEGQPAPRPVHPPGPGPVDALGLRHGAPTRRPRRTTTRCGATCCG